MQLLIPLEIRTQLVDALLKVGEREIGGILMGEHVGPDTFRVKSITIQRTVGSYAAFVRIVSEILAPLRAFFESTNHDYTRFNYIGEWHSHHSFALSQSGTDHNTMLDMVADPKLGARFVVLLLVKLNNNVQLEGSVVVYQPRKTPSSGVAVME